MENLDLSELENIKNMLKSSDQETIKLALALCADIPEVQEVTYIDKEQSFEQAISKLRSKGDDITVELKKEGLMGEYEWYEMGSSNKSWCNKKLIFRVNIEHIISRDDFRNVTFKRTKRF